MEPSRITATSTESSLSASGICTGLSVLARSTLCPLCSIGVITMKMISSTSITSTIGVTLMSELTSVLCFFLSSDAIDIRIFSRDRLLPYHVAALQEIVDQFARAVIHLHVECFHAVGEVVEHPDRRDGHE